MLKGSEASRGLRRPSGSVNGVSRLHGQVSPRLFQPLFPRFPEYEAPIGHVTNV
jgi:starch phosphorylase